MPLAPSPWLITGLTPEVIKALDGSIQTGAGRDGDRSTGPALPTAPEFTVSKTDISITAIITNPNGATSYEASIDGAAWVAGLTVSGLIAETPYPFQIRGINNTGTGAASTIVNVTTATAAQPNDPVSPGSLIFNADFETQPDWEGRTGRVLYPGQSTSAALPENFETMYHSSLWNEPGEEPVGQITNRFGNHEGPDGKAYIIYDESWGSQSEWGSESQLGKELGAVYSELYIEFYTKFQQGFALRDVLLGSSQTVLKVVRARYVPPFKTDSTRFDFFGVGGRENSPVYMLDFKSWTDNGGAFTAARLTPFIRGYTAQEDIGVDENYFLTSYEAETYVKQNGSTNLSFEEVWTDKWTKIGVYIKMDSAPGAGDGIEEVYINDVLEKSRYDIPYRRVGDPAEVGFNWVSIGGNMHNYPFAESERYKQWWGVSGFKVYNGKT